MAEDKQNRVRTPDPYKVLRNQLTVALLAALMLGGIAFFLGRQSRIQTDTAAQLTDLRGQAEIIKKKLDGADSKLDSVLTSLAQRKSGGSRLGNRGRK